jgi:beta-xylosidase
MQGYAQGTWAPSLREHNGEFYLYVCTPQDGLFMWHAKNPAGPWSETVTVKATNGWEDPCPFWDDDGQAYLVHSRVGAGPLILHHLSADGTQLLDDGTEIYRGNVSEGPKLFKRHGWYYVSLPEGGVDNGGQAVLRAKDIHGPYERRQVLTNGSPHQGGLVELNDGNAWFIAFKSTGFLGRVDHLIPVKWGADDWPVFGDNGQTVDRSKKPDVGRVYPVARPQASDEFDSPTLSPQWQWNHNPSNADWSLTERPGWLRLKALPPGSNAFAPRFGRGFPGATASPVALAHNTLTQKIWDDNGTAEVKLDTRKMADGQHAGFAFMSGRQFGWVGVEQTNGLRHIAWPSGQGPEVPSDGIVWLRGTYEGSTAHLFYSTDGQSFTDTGAAVTLRFDQWKGARIALYSYGDGGSADFDYFHYTYGKPAAP